MLNWFCSHVRAVIATLGGQNGAARRAGRWRHLYAGFTVWLSQSKASGCVFDISLIVSFVKAIRC